MPCYRQGQNHISVFLHFVSKLTFPIAIHCKTNAGSTHILVALRRGWEKDCCCYVHLALLPEWYTMFTLLRRYGHSGYCPCRYPQQNPQTGPSQVGQQIPQTRSSSWVRFAPWYDTCWNAPDKLASNRGPGDAWNNMRNQQTPLPTFQTTFHGTGDRTKNENRQKFNVGSLRNTWGSRMHMYCRWECLDTWIPLFEFSRPMRLVCCISIALPPRSRTETRARHQRRIPTRTSRTTSTRMAPDMPGTCPGKINTSTGEKHGVRKIDTRCATKCKIADVRVILLQPGRNLCSGATFFT